MARKIIGLIGDGQGPVIHTEGTCTAVVEGLIKDGVVTLCIDGKDPVVFEKDGSYKIGRPSRLSFSADRASRTLVCRVHMEA